MFRLNELLPCNNKYSSLNYTHLKIWRDYVPFYNMFFKLSSYKFYPNPSFVLLVLEITAVPKNQGRKILKVCYGRSNELQVQSSPSWVTLYTHTFPQPSNFQLFLSHITLTRHKKPSYHTITTAHHYDQQGPHTSLPAVAILMNYSLFPPPLKKKHPFCRLFAQHQCADRYVWKKLQSKTTFIYSVCKFVSPSLDMHYRFALQ